MEKEIDNLCDKHNVLLRNIKDNLPELEKLLEHVNDHWQYEDMVYRFYHHSFKVYWVQELTEKIVKALKKISPHDSNDSKDSDEINKWFNEIFKRGMGKTWKISHNKRWMKECAPMLEAFFHAKYFLEMAVKYGKQYKVAPQTLHSGWAALLCFYNLR